jgi:hypothetical protein
MAETNRCVRWLILAAVASSAAACGASADDEPDDQGGAGATGGSGASSGSGGSGATGGSGGAVGSGAGGAAGSDAGAAGGNPAGAPGDDGSTDAGADVIEDRACAEAARFVTGAVSHTFGPGQDIGQALFPTPILGPPKGAGCCQGSLDVVSLGNGGTVTLEFGTSSIVDGPGVDFIVFENAFNSGGDPKLVFAELATVEVSDDGTSWVAFECSANAAPYGTCAGWHPVHANADENAIDPLDPATAGGDGFDLAEIGVARARYVRITDRPDLTGTAGVFDLDAVGIVNVACD